MTTLPSQISPRCLEGSSNYSDNESSSSPTSVADLQSLLLVPYIDDLTVSFEQVESALAKFDYQGGDEVLDRAVEDCERVLRISLNPARDVRWMIVHAKALCLRFERDGQDDDLDKAKQGLEALVATQSLGSAMRAYALYCLGRLYEAHDDHYHSVQSKERACMLYREVLKGGMDQSDAPSGLFDETAVHLGREIMNLTILGKGDPSEAMAILSEVVQRIKESDPLTVYVLTYMGGSYYRRWYFGGRNKEDLIKGEEHLRKALILGPLHLNRPIFLSLLGEICMNYGTPDGIREGVQNLEHAVTLLSTLPPVRCVERGILSVLALQYAHIWESEGRLSDLNKAVQYSKVSISGTENMQSNHLINLCVMLCLRFEATGQLVDIHSAIDVAQQALERAPAVPLANLARSQLGRAHVLRFAASGEQEDFEAAQAQLETCIRGKPSPTMLPFFYLRLAMLYHLVFAVSNLPSDLDLAVDNGRRAVVLIEQMQISETPSIVSEHAFHLLSRFGLRRDPQDLAHCILLQEKALKLASIGYHDRHLLLCRYGHALRLRFEISRDGHDSERCEKVLRDALDRAIKARLPKQSIHMAEMGALYSTRYACYSNQEDLTQSLVYYYKAAHIPEGLTRDRFQAAVIGARLAMEYRQLEQSVELFGAAVSFLPRIAWLGLNASKRHIKLAQSGSQVACDAAAAAIRANRLERAVELLDEGRSVMWRSILELRTDLRTLEAAAPQLAKELVEVAQTLEHDDIGMSEASERHVEEMATRRRRMAERWEELVASVRCLEGFGSFLKPSDFSLLRQAARDGPAVFLNVSQYGSDALIVSFSEPVRAVPLPGLTHDTVRRLAYVLVRALHITRDQLGRQMLEGLLLDICRQLWDGGMDMIARMLQDWQYQGRDRPLHVWWIPTGFLSLLPVHCAGPYIVGHPAIPDLFISSYTTTLSALLRASHTRDPLLGSRSSAMRMLAIGLPETPGLSPLPSTRAEMEILANNPRIQDSCSYLYGPSATVGAVTAALPHYNWLHASCHGHFDPTRPLESAFNLIDGPLTLARVIQMRLTDADFAFLSACHTARHTAFVPDESLHITAGLQIAGVRGVIGTSWSMVDADGPKLTKRFYYWLTVDDRPLDTKNAAEALHLAIKDLRGTGVPLYRWAAFVHFGV